MSAGDWKEMYQAAQNGNLELVRYHIENDVNPNYQHPEILATPLVAAITAGHSDVAIYLLENKADPFLKSFFDDMTGIEAALHYKNHEVLTHLRRQGIPTRKSWKSFLSQWLRR
ncbi:ankyrin repeat domain-containing protein [Bdellovibrio bacteriovorus]|uniref:ankyrin repeat domain-containing protein n=1 Tax=Bdellovibrio bacteriovorus TaxID=959 RepID=UPI0021CF8350|nr:ankyrin repeat domain-containing protein [Bdellovibrio bacteriovorus]UXR66211.1 ankyrin repeat domain-containing protein [Bdellovibrio bacteriovorus]